MTTCPSCGIAGNNLGCPNHSFWGINPLPDSIPMPEQSAWASLYAEIGRLNVLLNERDKEIERLQHDVADLQMLRDEHQMDVMHAFQEGGEYDRRKVVAWLRQTSERMNNVTLAHAADCIEDGEHRVEEKE